MFRALEYLFRPAYKIPIEPQDVGSPTINFNKATVDGQKFSITLSNTFSKPIESFFAFLHDSMKRKAILTDLAVLVSFLFVFLGMWPATAVISLPAACFFLVVFSVLKIIELGREISALNTMLNNNVSGTYPEEVREKFKAERNTKRVEFAGYFLLLVSMGILFIASISGAGLAVGLTGAGLYVNVAVALPLFCIGLLLLTVNAWRNALSEKNPILKGIGIAKAIGFTLMFLSVCCAAAIFLPGVTAAITFMWPITVALASIALLLTVVALIVRIKIGVNKSDSFDKYKNRGSESLVQYGGQRAHNNTNRNDDTQEKASINNPIEVVAAPSSTTTTAPTTTSSSTPTNQQKL
jgi:hypothetical protein